MAKGEKIKNDQVLEEMIPDHKMGFKILTETQLSNMFPTYGNLFEKIDVHRAKIQSFDTEKMSQLDYQYNLMYDTIFSIFGSRGSGKTSAVFTLKKMIRERYEPFGDYVFPIIMPEMIPEACDLISWILAILGETVSELEKRLERDPQLVNNNDFFNNCRFRRDNRLRQEYNYIKELYFSKGYDVGREKSLEAAIGNNGIQVQYSYEFSQKLIRFWTTLKDAIAKANHLEAGQEPLIYFIFDDVDLTPHKVEEMLSTIVKYLSHPNIIAIVTADEELFSDVVEEMLKKKIGYYANSQEYQENGYIAFSNLDNYLLEREKNKEQKLRSMAHLYLGKVLPPSLRYYLKTFDSCDKRRVFIESVKGGEQKVNVNIEKFLRNQVNKLLECDGKKISNEYDNFLYFKADKKYNFIENYLLFWGNTSRQLANECFLIEELFKQMIAIRKKCESKITEKNIIESQMEAKEEIYQQIHHFLYNSLNTDGNIKLEKDEIENLVNHVWNKDYEKWVLYIRYDYLNEYYRRNVGFDARDEEAMQIVDAVTRLYVLLFFVENLLIVWNRLEPGLKIYPNEKERQKRCRSLVALLDRITGEENSIVRYDESNNASEFLYKYGWLMERLELIMDFDVYNRMYAQDYLYMLDSRLKADAQKLNADSLRKWSEKNPKWFATMVGLTYLEYRNLYVLDEHDMVKLGVNGKVGLYDDYIRDKQFELNDIIKKYFTGKNEDADRTSYHFFELIKGALEEDEKKDMKEEQLKEPEEERNEKKRLCVSEIYNAMNQNYSKDFSNDNYKIKYFLFLLKNGVFPSGLDLSEITKENSDVQLETLMSYLKSMLVSYSRSFKMYSIQDLELFIKFLNDMNYTRIIKYGMAYGEDNTVIIDAEELESIHDFVNELYLRQNNLQPWDVDNINVNLDKWLQVIDQVQLFIPENKKEDIKILIAIWESINYMQDYYIPLYIKMKEDITTENREESFSKKFYDEVQKILRMNVPDSINGDSYFRALVSNQMERSGREYYNRIAKKGTKDDE